MKKLTMKKMLAVLSLAFAVSATAGLNVALAAAEENDATTIDAAFSSVDLVDGASVRYNDDGNGMGLSFALKMNETAYAEVMSAESGYSNVKFGVLISLNDYYKVHPFNTQENIDTYYSLNEQVSGKAFAYDMQKTELVENPYEAGTVYFRASIVDIKDANMTLDYRAVGYVEYTKDIDGVATTEKYFFTDDVDSVRCPVEVSDIAIATMKADGVTEDEQTKIDTLNTNYSSKVDWTALTPDVEPDSRWYQSWGVFTMGYSDITGTLDPFLPTAYRGNRYIESKYTTTYEYVKEGYESVPYATHAIGSSTEDQETCRGLEGVWTLTGTTVCEMLDEPVVTYTKNITFNKMYQMQMVNGAHITGTTSASGAANTWQDRFYADGSVWNEETGKYNFVDADGGWIIGYSEKATNDFIVDFEISGTTQKDFRIYTATDKWIGIRTKVTANGFFVRSTAWASEASLAGTSDIYTPITNGLNLRIAMYNDVLYFFGNTYTNASNEFATRDNWLLLGSLDSTRGLMGANGMKYINHAQSGSATNYKAVKDAATLDEYAFAFCAVQHSAATAYMTLNDDDVATKSFVETYASNVVNGEFFNASGRGWILNNGVWENAESGGIVDVGKASGDYMVRMKLQSADSLDFRVYNSATNYFSIVSETTSGAHNRIFMDSLNGGWFRENRIGYNTSKFLNEDGITTTGDGYLDIMLVRYQGAVYAYTCEYLDAEGNAATHDSWQLLFQVNADGSATAVDGISHKDANGTAITGLHSTLRTQMLPIMQSTENLFALRWRTGGPMYAKVNITDDDTAVANFMSGSKLVADYAKA